MDRKPVIFADAEATNAGPAIRGTASRTLSVVIGDAFGGSSPVTFTFDGFDRNVASTDPTGGALLSTFDPGGRGIAVQFYGSPGGPTPADNSGSGNVLLASAEARFDEAGRKYETQRDVFLDGGTYYMGVGGNLPSGRTVTHTGGGLASNSTTNNHIATVTLTAGGRSYVLRRNVFDRAGRLTAVAADNGAITSIALDGAGRRPLITDALGNSLARAFDGNANAVFTTRSELCTISGTIAAETFSSAAAFDVLDRPIVTMEQGADGSLTADWPTCCADTATATLITYVGFDSRGNRTNLVDPRQNTVIWELDGASRQLREKRHLRPSGDGTTSVYAIVLTQLAYDANSNTVLLIDSNGGRTGWAYDLLDRDTVMTLHDGSTRVNVFNAASDVTGYTDENGSVFTNTPDVLGRITAVAIAPAAGVAGSAALIGTPGTLSQNFQFDGLSRPTFGRDSVGTVGFPGRTNADVGFTRDSIDRVLEEQQTYLDDTRYITHNAWTSFPGTGFTFPNNRQINKSFDLLYRKNGINETSSGASIAAWQFFGQRVATVALGNDIVTSFMNNAQTRSAIQLGQSTSAWGSISTDQLGYDGAARPIGKRHILSGTTIVGFTSAYDQSSNKLFERALHAESRSSLYSNDSMDRLLSYQRGTLATGGGSITTPIALPGTDIVRNYTLDGLGNWPNTSFTPVGGSPSLDARTHNKLNQITVFDAPSAPTPVLYDHGNNTVNASRGNGNIVNDGTRANVFDALNRLVTVNRVSGGLQIGGYVYDAIGRRIIREIRNGGLPGTIPNATTRCLLDGQQIVEELAGTSGSTALQYVWGQYIDDLVQLNALMAFGPRPLSVGNYYLLGDLLYRSAALTNSSGIIVETYDTSAYGDTLLFSAGGGTGGAWWSNADTQSAYSACRYVFTGREYDAEAQNYFYRGRYLQARLGRFISRDPVGYLVGPSLYEYAQSAPTGATDSLGLAPKRPPPYESDLYITFGVDATFPDIGRNTPAGDAQSALFSRVVGAQLAGLEAQIARCRESFPDLPIDMPAKVIPDYATVGHSNKPPLRNGVPDYTRPGVPVGQPFGAGDLEHNINNSNTLTGQSPPSVWVMITSAELDTSDPDFSEYGVTTGGGIAVQTVATTTYNNPNVLSHELGHYVGLGYWVPNSFNPHHATFPPPFKAHLDPHSPDPKNLMYPFGDPGQIADRKWCCGIARLADRQSLNRYLASLAPLPKRYQNIPLHNIFTTTRPSK